MTDAVTIALISAGLTLILAIVTPLMMYLTNKKVDEYHKEVNSKLSQLVVAEKGKSHLEGKAEGKAEQKQDDHEKSNN